MRPSNNNGSLSTTIAKNGPSSSSSSSGNEGRFVLESQLDLDITNYILSPSKALSRQETDKRNLMLEELQNLLNFGTVHPFGSFLTGIGDADSDVDVYFEDKTERRDEMLLLNLLPKLITGAFKNGQKFGYILKVVHKARIPIITFRHLETEVTCDLSFDNLMAVQNSKLIKFLLSSFHPICLPLTMFLRSWARSHDLIHASGLKSYAISLLVIIFFVRKKLLPSVKLLQSLVPEQFIHNTWNVAFCDDVPRIQEAMRRENLSSSSTKDQGHGFGFTPPFSYERPSDLLPLILEFFQMLRMYSGPDRILSAFTGDYIDRRSFIAASGDDMTPSFVSYARSNEKIMNTRFSSWVSLSIQDPFDLSFNVTFNCNAKTWEQVHLAMSHTSIRIYDSMEDQHLYDLLTPGFELVPRLTKNQRPRDFPRHQKKDHLKNIQDKTIQRGKK